MPIAPFVSHCIPSQRFQSSVLYLSFLREFTPLSVGKFIARMMSVLLSFDLVVLYLEGRLPRLPPIGRGYSDMTHENPNLFLFSYELLLRKGARFAVVPTLRRFSPSYLWKELLTRRYQCVVRGFITLN